MASHKQSFQCFDTITDDPSLKTPFPHGHCSSASFRGSSGSTRLESLEDHGCYLCADHQQAKAMASEATGAYSNPWYHFQTHPHSQQYTVRRPTQPEEAPGQVEDHHHHHHHHHRHSRKIVLVKNSDPSVRKTIVLHRRSLRSLALFMDEVSELMQCLIRKLYTLEGHKIDSVQSLLQCPSILVCVGREPCHPLLLDSFRKNSYDKLPRLNTKQRSSVFNFGLETKRSVIHPRCDSSNRSARLSISSEKLFPNGLNSLPPGHRGACPHPGENTMDDDIEKRVLVNKDGSLSMEMKVRFRLLHNETLHWSTEVKKAKSTFNEYPIVPDDRHFEEPHCQHCCAHCQEYDIWKNLVPPDQGSVRRIRSSSSSASSRRIVCKKASTDNQDEAQEKEDVQERASSAISVKSTTSARSRKSETTPKSGEEMKERAPSVMSVKSNASLKSNKSKMEEEEIENRASSVLSVKSEEKSNQSDIEQMEKRPSSAISAKSNVSVRSKGSKMSEVAGDDDRLSAAALHTSETSNECSTAPEEACKGTEKSPDKEKRARSALSTKSSNSAKSKKSKISDMADDIVAGDRDDLRSASAMSSKSNVSVKSAVSELVTEEPLEAQDQTEERAQSALSAQSNHVSEIKSEKSSKCRKRIGSGSSCHKMDDDMSELSPSCLPNASPTEVVNEWLRKIPSDTTLCDFGDEFHDSYDSIEPLCTSHVPSGDDNQHGSLRPSNVTKIETQNEMEDAHVVNTEGATDKKSPEVAEGDHSQRGDEPKMFDSSVLVMKVLLSPKLDRCNSLPEVSSVYGLKLSASAQGLLDCLANLQLLDFGPSDEDGKKEKYQELMSMLKSLWLCDPKDSEKTSGERNKHLDEEFKARSSSGVDVNSGSTGSGKSSVNDGTQAQINTECEVLETLTKVQEVDETVEGEASETPGSKDDSLKDDVPGSEETIRSDDSPREFIETPLSSNKSSGNNPKKEETESDRQEDTGSGSAPKQQRGHLSKRLSQDPDPVWVLNLLNKLEKQFMTHYVNAMVEFKVRWNLDDNEQLDTMICELQDEVRRRIQSSVDRELRKIQGRAGRPRPPKDTMSRESTIQTEQRRRRLKVMRNQSVDPQPAKSDDDYTMTGTDFSDQRSDDEYCPCDTCLKKKMASKHVLPVEMLNSAAVMMDFDLRRILQMKKSAPNNEKIEETANVQASEMEGENAGLEAVKEEDEKEGADKEILASSAQEIEDEKQECEENEEEDRTESVEEGEATAEAVAAGENGIVGCDTAEEGETAEGETAEDGQMAEYKTSRDGEAAEDETAEDGQTAEAESTLENGQTSEDVTGDECETINDEIGEGHETSENETTEDGQTAEDETGEEGETVNKDTAEEHETAESETAEDGQTAEDETGEEGETVNKDTAEEHETAESET
uniref:Uncharacterized LOC107684790 n=1 Tax=Sinocyclocheilus anshuiensis TaxID=1608454 RepID=A0A671PZC2_9TELE